MPQYQGVWNLQDAARLQSQQQWVTDPNFRSTTLLLQADNAAGGAQNNTFLDSSSNNLTVTRNGGSPGMTQGTFTPFSQGWSNFFNGGSAISAPLSTFSSVNFTIEAWIYLNATATGTPQIIATTYNIGGAQTGTFIFGVGGNGFLFAQNHNSAASGSTIVAPNTWHHVAMTYTLSTTTIQVFLNGIPQGTASAPITTSSGFMIIGGSPGDNNIGTWFLNGYVSNFRATRSQVLYSGLFSPAISPLSTTSVGSTGAGAASSITGTVSLLTCQSNRFVDNSASALTISLSSVPSVQPFAPFAPQFQYTQSVIGGSAYFDGTGDYLTLPNNATTTIGSSDYTFEGWFYTPAVSALQTLYTYGSGSGGFRVFFNLTNLWFLNGATTIFQPTNVIRANEWIHVALVRSGSGTNNTAVWINGTRAAQQTNTTSFVAAPPQLGMESTSSNPYTGYMSSVRLVKSALYNPANASIPIPTAPFTNSSSPAFLLNFTNAGIIDGTMDNVLETVGNAQISTSVVKYGSGSMYFDGTTDALSMPNSPVLQLGSADFTCEFWAYRLAATNMTWVFLNGNSSNFAALRLDTDTSGNIFLLMSTSGSAWAINTSGSAVLPLSTWTHIAAVRFGGTMRLYVNGVALISTTISGSLTAGTSQQVGANFGATQVVNGYVDDLRLTNGIARYISNFTPPQVALPRQ